MIMTTTMTNILHFVNNYFDIVQRKENISWPLSYQNGCRKEERSCKGKDTPMDYKRTKVPTSIG